MNKFIIKSKLNSNFSILPNDIVNKEGMSLEAKGLMWYLLSKPEDWELSVPDIIKHSTKKRDAIDKVINELEVLGYLKKEHHRKKNGVFDGWDYFVFDAQQNVDNTMFSPNRENPHLDKPNLVKPEQLSTEVILSTNIISKDISSKSVSSKDSTDTTRNNFGKVKFTYQNIEALKTILKVGYPKQLRGFSDPKTLRSMWLLAQPRKGKDEWMSSDPMENLKRFFSVYLTDREEQYCVGDMFKLNQELRDWRERGGK